jgi:acyl-CoA synthetase (AMP-forming)/AMP-acid ligase II
VRTDGLWELVCARAEATPEALFAIDGAERRLRFAEYRDAALRVAAGLAERGVGTDVPVSWMLPTRLESLVLFAALARLGARQNPVLPIYRERELGFVLRQTGARLLLVPGRFRGFDYAAMARELAAPLPELAIEVVDPELPEGDPERLPPAAAPAGDAPARFVYYTSGTTADPKGALHSDASLLAAADVLAAALELRPDDRVGMVFPFSHIGGAAWLGAALESGCALIVVESFDPEGTPALLARHGVTHAGAGTVFHQAYLTAQLAHGEAKLFPRVRSFPGGGAPKPPQLHFDLKARCGGAGVVSGYGLTECPIITMGSLDDSDEKLARTEGRASPAGATVAIVRADGSRAGPDEEGEVRVRGPQLCQGYLDAKLDADAFDADGLFRTGDLGALDADGYLRITGRLKDVIIRKGENISAKQVEDLLYEHPDVADVAVVGLPDPELGERCCAVVVCAPAAQPLRLDDVVAFLASKGLARQKIPERLELVAALPRNPSGKILKTELRDRYAAD